MSGMERHREMELIRLISKQKTFGGDINGERRHNGRNGVCK